MRILIISNGHGEDVEAMAVVAALHEAAPNVSFLAAPLVGLGEAYRSNGIPIVVPTKVLPSGGFFYLKKHAVWKDIAGGLVGLTLRQIAGVREAARNCDLVFAAGDVVAASLARVSGRPYIAFLASLSALYSGKLVIDWPLRQALSSPRCLRIITKDSATADDLRSRGFVGASFGGWPAIDRYVGEGRGDHGPAGLPLALLLPGSRPPEALRNLRMLLALVDQASRSEYPLPAFALAATPTIRREFAGLASSCGWVWNEKAGVLSRKGDARRETTVPVGLYDDLLPRADVAIGAAGLALELAAIAGLPVIQVPGEGPQFTPNFAARQRALLGPGATFVEGTGSDPARLEAALRLLRRALTDNEYRKLCRNTAEARFAASGASRRIAEEVLLVLRGL